MSLPDLTDTQKLRMIPRLERAIEELKEIIITGDPRKGSQSLLEIIRNTREDVREIKQKQESAAKLEERIKAIEERHKIIDAQNARDEQEAKKLDMYKIAVFSMVVSNIGIIIMMLLGFAK